MIKKAVLLFLVIVISANASVYARDALNIKETASGLIYDSINFFSDGEAVAWRDAKAVFINKTGVPFSLDFDSAFHFYNGVARVMTDGRKWNYIDKSGKPLITFDYDEVGNFHDGMAWVTKDGKYGYINTSGELVIPMVYDVFEYDEETSGGVVYIIDAIMHDFSEGLAAVLINGKCGFMDKTGELVIPAVYDGNFFIGEWGAYQPTFKNGLARVIKEGESGNPGWGIINTAGETVVPFGVYRIIGNGFTGHFHGGLAKVYTFDNIYTSDNKSGLIDQNGEIAVPLIYDLISDFNGDLAYVEIIGQGGAYIDRTGRRVTPFDYYADQWQWWWYAESSEGMTIANKNGKFGVLDSGGNIIVPFEYDDIQPFSGGLARISYGGSYGFADKAGNIIVPPGYYDDAARSFSNGLAWVKKDGRYGYINTSGELILPVVYESNVMLSENLLPVKTAGGTWSVLEFENLTLSAAGEAPKTGDSFVYILYLLFICFILIFIPALNLPKNQ